MPAFPFQTYPNKKNFFSNIQRPLILYALLFVRRAHEQYEDKDNELKRNGEDNDNQERIYLNENGMFE
jgi:hypothetical protein